MPLHPVGSTWLQKHFRLDRHVLTHASYIGSNASVDLTSGRVEQVYGPKYAPGDRVLNHVEFALKYDDLNLDFFKAVLENIPEKEILAHIEGAPSSKYARKISFLYEFLTGKELAISQPVSGNYVDLISPDDYVTAAGIRSQKWRINDNLLGNRDFCPVVRRTKELSELLAKDIQEQIESLKTEFSPEIFRRASMTISWKYIPSRLCSLSGMKKRKAGNS